LLRGDALDALTAADVDLLVREVGVAHVVDLRAASERMERAERRLQTADLTISEIPVIEEHHIEMRQAAREAAFSAGEDPPAILAQGYLQLLELGGAAFARAFERIVARGGTPALVHCSAGKDRTGVLVALMLDAVGVEREAIVADYAATQERMGAVVDRLRSAHAYHDLARQVPSFVYEARPETMLLFLAGLDDAWGGGGSFLRAQGVDDAALERWRQLFVGRGVATVTGP
jgi:protein tyrosine/serine phosphatase